ncbi:MAG: Nitrate reductase [Anaerosporomusa subterranea]|nr:Nitrate reductase [Anaerosporomusa subterranea]
MEKRRSVCPYDCPDACGLVVEVENGKAVKVAGDKEHPFTRGALCPKMVNYEQTVHSPDRLTTPLQRVGPKGSGRFRPISWETAIRIIADKWQTIIREDGAEAILPCSYAGTMGLVQRNAGHALFYKMGASQLDRTICSPAKGYAWEAIMGKTLSVHPDEVMDSDLVILWSSNTMATNIHFLHGVREAKRRGAQVWMIDTYENATAQIADKVFLVKPGSDGALALGIMHILVRDGLTDETFIAEHVQGYEELQERILPDYTPEAVSALTGIEAEVIIAVAHAYARARAPFISLGSGLSRYGNGSMATRTIIALPALVGAWAKQGGGLLSSVGSASAIPMAAVTREDLLEKPTRIINMNQLGDALNQPEKPLKSIYVYHYNPAAVNPDQNQVIKGLEREDLFTVVHERFMTDTANYADIVLPCTSSLEQSDLYRSYGQYVVQRAYAAISPIGESKSNKEVFALLAEAMGYDEPVLHLTADEHVDLLIETGTPWLNQVNKEKLNAGEPVELPLPDNHKLTFKTPSGKIELLNPREAEPLPRYFAPYGDTEPFWLMTAPSLYGLNSSFSERTELIKRRGDMPLLMNPADAAAKGLVDGQKVVVFNGRGEVVFTLQVTPKTPSGVVVAEGVWKLNQGFNGRTVNALTSQRLTDRAGGSTFYDTKVDIRSA